MIPTKPSGTSPINAQPPDELVSADQLGRFHLTQPGAGYRFSIDSVLLADFAGAPKGPIADLGAGCGVLGVLLHGAGASGPFIAVEIDPLAAQCCGANYAANGVDGQVLEHDLNHGHPQLAPGGFGMVICNPPFGRKGHGRLPPEAARARARHELALSAERLWMVAADLLQPRGRIALCWPPARLVACLAGLQGIGLAPKRLRLVHGRASKPASLALIEAVKNGGEQLDVLPPLMVYGQGQEYSDEVAAMYQHLE